MTREESEQLLRELEEKVKSGEYVRDTLFLGSFPLSNTNRHELKKNINKYPFFRIDTEMSIHRWFSKSTSGGSVDWQEIEEIPDNRAFTRDYINKWEIDNEYYTVSGNFGETGTSFGYTNFIKKPFEPEVKENQTALGGINYATTGVYGYRPKRKTIYVYKNLDDSIYLTSSADELLYTSDDKKIVVNKESV